eukprot:4332445-Pleurochrysis_carterae.AAC.4
MATEAKADINSILALKWPFFRGALSQLFSLPCTQMCLSSISKYQALILDTDCFLASGVVFVVQHYDFASSSLRLTWRDDLSK